MNKYSTCHDSVQLKPQTLTLFFIAMVHLEGQKQRRTFVYFTNCLGFLFKVNRKFQYCVTHLNQQQFTDSPVVSTELNKIQFSITKCVPDDHFHLENSILVSISSAIKGVDVGYS